MNSFFSESRIEEVRFESQITYTKKMMKAFFKAYFLKSKLWMLLLIPIMLIVFGAITYVDNGSNSGLLSGIYLEIILIVIVFIRYKINTKSSYDRICEQNHGEEITNIVCFYDDRILLTNSFTGNKIEYNYFCIKRVMEHKNLIMLITKAKVIIAVEKVRFSIGTSNDLISFIKQKIRANKETI